ncbi:hypothetical protein FB45DRAFT_871321 [Roridomyces roridus]|uniref:Uncharacterized protein n=1 Tax=Roridomyces roridus TaxID=1738132 RepID=A0AAD7FF57_9AGAR|nr:hypothetical protein FB45DRAFT_871321 [Roridomyces roridus]
MVRGMCQIKSVQEDENEGQDDDLGYRKAMFRDIIAKLPTRPLNAVNAIDLGFPTIQLRTDVRGYSWDTSVYEGLRQFHAVKGFDPDSQDLAKHLRCPLFYLCDAQEALVDPDSPLLRANVHREGFLTDERKMSPEFVAVLPRLYPSIGGCTYSI